MSAQLRAGERGRTLLAVELALLGLPLLNRLGLLDQPVLLLLLGLGPVLVEQAEQLRRRVLVERRRELGDRRGDLEPLAEDDLLALEADVFGPLDEAGQVALRLDVGACATESATGEDDRHLARGAHRSQNSWACARAAGSSSSSTACRSPFRRAALPAPSWSTFSEAVRRRKKG